MKSALFVGAAASALFTAGQVNAFDDPYFALSGGLNLVAPITVTPTGSYDPRDLDFDTGFVGSASFGHRFHDAFRVEGELSFRHNNLAGVTIQTEGPQSLNGGSINAFGVMANGWFDIPTGTGVTPYVGGGIGAAHVRLAADTNLGGGGGCALCLEIDYAGSAWLFAYQLGAGVAIGLPSGAKVTLDYRYFHTGSFTVPATVGPGGPGTASGYSAQSAMIGFRAPIGASP